MWPLLLSLALGATEPSLAWSGAEGQALDLWIRSEVGLPRWLWIANGFNKEARVIGVQLTGVYRCRSGRRIGRSATEWLCTIEDVALLASSVPADHDRVQPILEEWDERLTGSIVQLRMRDDGRLVSVDLEGVSKRNPREAGIHETLRLLLGRSFAGLDLELPDGPVAQGRSWAQFESQLFQGVSASGSLGSSQTAHLVSGLDGTTAEIQSMGKGTFTPGMWGAPGTSGIRGEGTASSSLMALDYYDTIVDSVAIFDHVNHRLIDRVWTATAHPTAGSQASEGAAGIPYVQRGQLRLVEPGADAPSVGRTSLVLPDGSLPGVLAAPVLPDMELR